MCSANVSEPEQYHPVLHVGQDRAGHWLVQDHQGLMEGRFISRDAAFAFARTECRGVPGATILIELRPLVPMVAFDPAQPNRLERAA